MPWGDLRPVAPGRRFGVLAVVVPWVLAVVLALLHLARS
jgi:hypothetical protein